MESRSFSRRQALKALAAAGGGLALGFVPVAWKTPVIEGGTLPVHAQTSALTCAGDMCAVATTTTLVTMPVGTDTSSDPGSAKGIAAVATEEYGDFDFGMCTPNGFFVWNGSSGDGAASSDDNIAFTPRVDNETLDISSAVPGTYSLYMANVSSDSLDMTVQVITPAGTFSRGFSLPVEEYLHVADVVYPGGALTWVMEPGYPQCEGQAGDIAGKCVGGKACWPK